MYHVSYTRYLTPYTMCSKNEPIWEDYCNWAPPAGMTWRRDVGCIPHAETRLTQPQRRTRTPGGGSSAACADADCADRHGAHRHGAHHCAEDHGGVRES